MAKKIYKVPAIFYYDHIGRDCGTTDRIIQSNKNHYVVELDEVGYEDLLTDADYYWDCREMMDMCNPKIIRSAKRTFDYLVKVGGPDVTN